MAVMATMSLYCTVNEILSLFPHNLEITRHITLPFQGYYIMHALVLLGMNQLTKFTVHSFTISKNMIGGNIKNKKLCYCRRTTMLVNMHNISQGTGVRKVSNSKSNLHSHSRAFSTMPFDRPHTISY